MEKYHFAEMIWYEIREAARQDRVAVLPVATYEDHGPHLPVDVEKAVDERSPLPPSFQSDLLAGSHPKGSVANLVPYWSSQSGSGVKGDATRATVEKGRQFLEAAIEGLIELIRELKATPILPRRDQH